MPSTLFKSSNILKVLGMALMLIFFTGCATQRLESAPTSTKEQKIVITSISPLADLIKNVGGDAVQVVSLVPPGSDPHTYEPTPEAIRQVAKAQVLFANGVGQETYLEKLIANSQNKDLRTVILAEGLPILGIEEDHAAEAEKHVEGDGHDHSQGNPHLWLDVKNAQSYVEKIRDVLSETYPQDQAVFEANAAKYLQELESLDRWIREEIKSLPEENRKLIVYHDAWAYYAQAYGLTVLKPVVRGGEEAEPSAKDYAELIELIRRHNIKAVFGEVGFNPKLLYQLAQETNVQVVEDLYNDTLGVTPDTDSYIEMMQHNTKAIVSALK